MFKNLSSLVKLTLLVLLIHCNNKEEGPKIQAENPVNEFVWRGMNSWYFWQAEVKDLSDDRFRDESERNEFLNSYTESDELFYDLLHPDDDFSWIVDDYVALENSFKGVSKSFGYDFQLLLLNEEEIIGYVQLVLPNSPAELAGIKRGDIFYAVDGINLTDDNYIDLLFSNESYTLSFADFVDGAITPNGRTESLSATVINENPVYLAKVLEIEDKKIGYLTYNNFRTNYHSELNAAIGEIRSQNIDEMVLDLRYNTGGSTLTTSILAGMLYDDATSNDIVSKLIFNSKKQFRNVDNFATSVPILDDNGNQTATETMNRLTIDRLYVLVTGTSASASEVLINGLGPFMEVILVGTRTRGKNEASITLYDSPQSDFTDRNQANPNHTWAMQPIIAKVANSQDFYDFGEGFDPDIEVSEIDFFYDLKPIGNPEDPLLKAAINDIFGLPQTSRISPYVPNAKSVYQSRLHGKFSDEMYLNGMY